MSDIQESLDDIEEHLEAIKEKLQEEPDTPYEPPSTTWAGAAASIISSISWVVLILGLVGACSIMNDRQHERAFQCERDGGRALWSSERDMVLWRTLSCVPRPAPSPVPAPRS